MIKLSKHQRFSHPLLGGLISALLFSFLWRVVGDFATIFALIPLFVVGLMNDDLKKLGLAFFLSVLSTAILLGLDQVLNYVLYVAVPGLALPRFVLQSKMQARKKIWYPLDRLSGVLGLYSLGVTLILALIWHLTGASTKAFITIQDTLQQSPLEMQDRLQLLLNYLKILWPYVPGISMGLFALMIPLSVSFTQKWFKHNNNKFPRPALKISDLYLPWWCWKAFAVFGVGWAAALQTDYTAIQHLFGNITLPLVALFLLQGLAIITAFAKKQKKTKMFLVIFYGFVLVFSWTLLILILGGLLEPWLDLRTRLLQTKEKE